MAKLPRIITRTLSFRLSLTVIAALATLLLVALLIIFVFSRKAVKEEALQDAGQTLEATMQRIDNILLKVEQSSGNMHHHVGYRLQRHRLHLHWMDQPRREKCQCHHHLPSASV